MAKGARKDAIIDVDGGVDTDGVPSGMYEKTCEVAESVGRIRVQCRPGDGSTSYRFVNGGRGRSITPIGSMEPTEICKIALEMAREHAEEHPDDGAKYRAVYDFHTKNGKVTPKYAAIKAFWNDEGLAFDDDGPDHYETERERMLSAANDDLRVAQQQAHSLTMHAMTTYVDSIAKIGGQIEKMTNGYARIGESMATTIKGVGEGMTQAGELYRQGQARTIEQERLRLEAQLINREMDESSQKWDLLKQGLPLAAMAVAKQLGIPMETAIQLVQLMAMLSQSGSEGEMLAGLQGGAQAITGGGGGAMPGLPPGVTPEQLQQMQAMQAQAAQAQAAQAQSGAVPAQPVTRPAGWQYPGPLDLDDVPDDAGLSVDLGAWFAERDEHEEREVRAIVEGIEPGLYDALRAAPTHGSKATTQALTAFAVRVDGLGLGALGVLGKLRAALGGATDGAAAVTEFQTLMNRARTGGG